MGSNRTPNHGGIHISAGRDAHVSANGDVVAGDKITTTTTQVMDIEALATGLAQLAQLARDLRRAVDEDPGGDARARDEVVHALSGAGKELGAASEEVRALPSGQGVPAALSTRIKDNLATLDEAGKSASSLVASLHGMVIKLGPIVSFVSNLLG